ncbi:hypothetical protein ACHAXR_004362 [Thalassiosira sp. AJA248-18]
MASVILAIDIDAGSSIIRCTGYEYHGISYNIYSGEPYHAQERSTKQPSSTLSSCVKAIDGICHTIQMTSFTSSTGYLRIHEVLSAIDRCIDEVLLLLRQSILQDSSFQIVAIGFSTSAMNLIGVDMSGEPVGESATVSYACNREEVVKECQSLKIELGPEKLHELYQRTGVPMSAAYATPQLLAFYANEKNQSLISNIYRWQTISNICLYRWSGKPHFHMPISISEASLMGLLNSRTCAWDDDIIDILERCCDVVPRSEDDDVFGDDIDLLPPVADFDVALPYLKNGIPPYCDDGSENSYWDRWPELRPSVVSLFLGVGDGVAANMGSLADCSSMDVVIDGDSSESTSRGVAMMIARSMRQRPDLPHQCQSLAKEPLVVAHEAKAKTAWRVEAEHWRSVISAQESPIAMGAPECG